MLQAGESLMPHMQAGSLIEDSPAGGRKAWLVALPGHQPMDLRNQEKLRWASPIRIVMSITCLLHVHNSQVWFGVLGDSGKRDGQRDSCLPGAARLVNNW